MTETATPPDAPAGVQPSWPLILTAADWPEAFLFGAGAAGEIVLSGYGNIFPAAYFRAYAPDLRVALRLVGSGEAGVALRLEREGGVEVLATETATITPTWTSVEIRLSDLPADGVLTVVLTPAPGARIAAAAWVATTPPRRAPRLSVGVTTFNRPEAALQTAALLAASPEVAEARIVNQGDPLPEAPDGAAVIQQPNLGGAGGFTRALMEAMAGEATHHVFMDDDAAPPPEVFPRLAFFLAHAERDLAVGGQMVAAEDPMVLAEFGIRLTGGGETRHIGRRLRVDGAEARALFHRPTPIDAHAWWFWATPLSAAREAGLPLPLFIKFDDVEYTDRLRRRGVETVALPGLFTRHPSIHMKGAAWSPYYLARNRAIAASCFGRDGPGRGYGLTTVIGALLRHEYMRAALEAAALEDYLAGPERLAAADASARHEEIRAIAARGPAPTTAPRPAEAIFAEGGGGEAASRYARALGLAFLPTGRKPPVVWTSPDPVDPMLAAGRTYMRPLADGETCDVYAFDRRRLLRALPRALFNALRFALRAPAAARRWRDAGADLVAEDAWRRRF